MNPAGVFFFVLAQLPVGKTILVYANDPQPTPAPPPAEVHTESIARPQADLLEVSAPPPLHQQLSSPPPSSAAPEPPARPLPTPPSRPLPEPPQRALPAHPQSQPAQAQPAAAAAFDPFSSAFPPQSTGSLGAPAVAPAVAPAAPVAAAEAKPAATAAASAAAFGSGLMDKFNATKDIAMSKASEAMDKARQSAAPGTAPAQVACPGGVADATANLVHTMGHHPSSVEAVQTNVPPPPYEAPPSYADGDERNRKNAVTEKQNEQFKKVLHHRGC